MHFEVCIFLKFVVVGEPSKEEMALIGVAFCLFV